MTNAFGRKGDHRTDLQPICKYRRQRNLHEIAQCHASYSFYAFQNEQIPAAQVAASAHSNGELQAAAKIWAAVSSFVNDLITNT
jgi:hypothetical protein